jgi:hypothetical protein
MLQRLQLSTIVASLETANLVKLVRVRRPVARLYTIPRQAVSWTERLNARHIVV